MSPLTYDPHDGWTNDTFNHDTPVTPIHHGDDSRVLTDVETGAINIQVDEGPIVEIHGTNLKIGHVRISGNTDGSKIHYREIK